MFDRSLVHYLSLPEPCAPRRSTGIRVGNWPAPYDDGDKRVRIGKSLDRLLSVCAPVEPGEGPTAFLLMMNLFILMTAYYIIKPIRESLILGEAGPELKSYAGALGALAFL